MQACKFQTYTKGAEKSAPQLERRNKYAEMGKGH